jgi:AraC family transcriptional regulator, regulatory protein of adaptative response / methylated-DNA-[protein]-cysteine methyltransferase
MCLLRRQYSNAKGKPMNAPMRRLPASTLLPTEQDPRWAAVIARDRSADGSFYYSVSTTGVYCRPSCPARHAKPSHVRFHRTRADAERAGFRACKRCKPDQLSDESDARIATRVEAIDWAAAARSLTTMASRRSARCSRHRSAPSLPALTMTTTAFAAPW